MAWTTVSSRKLSPARKAADLCLEQLRAGMAWVFTRYASELPTQRRADCVAAERSGRDEHRGLWRDIESMPPREWRHK